MPPAPCCPDESEPLLLLENYAPKGQMVTLPDGLPCYVIGSGPRAVIMFTDVFGLHTGRHKQFCDDLAADGYFVICPDFFAADPYLKKPPAFGQSCGCFLSFVWGLLTGGFGRRTKSFKWDTGLSPKVVGTIMPWMEQQGARSFATVGFCWGSYPAFKCATLPQVKCCVSFHPSVDGFCKQTGEDDLQVCREVKCPQLVVATKNESAKWKPGGPAHKACEEALPGAGALEWKLEAAMMHGYMSRGVTTKPGVLEAVKRGYIDMVAFFKANMN